jgi:hypothetical protein
MGARKQHFGLDSALRYMYDTLRYMRCRLLAIEFEHRGKKYRADTAREAAELQALLDSQDEHRGRTRLKAWSADVTLEFLNSLGEMQKGFLSVLSQGSNVPSETMVEALRLDSEIALAGVISGLSKQARKLNINPHDLYVVESHWSGKQRERSFRILDDFRESLSELGWPDAWKEEKQPK